MRLIDADALQNILLTISTALEHEYGSLGGAVSGCMKHIDNAPTVDAVPVVRCRECKQEGGVMDEYIEREATIKLLRSLGSRDYRREKGTIQDAIKMISSSEYTPAADVAPVRHGRWIDKGEYAVCTECGGRSGTQYDGVEPIPLMTQFCPNCGAKMDGGNG